MSKHFKVNAFLISLLVALGLLSWLPRLRGWIDLRWDGSVYYTLGASLAKGDGYRLLYEPGEIREVHYPPLFPVIIAAHLLVTGTTELSVAGHILRLSWMVIHILFVLLAYHFGKIYLSRAYAFLLAVMCLLSARVTFMSDLCTPEILFSTILLIFLIDSKTKTNGAWGYLLASAAYLIRTAGVSLLVVWVAEKIFQKEYKKAIIRFLFAVIPVLVWSGYIRWVESTPEYKNPSYEYQRADYLNYNVSYARNLSYKDPYSPELGKLTLANRALLFVENLKFVPQSIAETFSWEVRTWKNFWLRFNNRLPFPIPFTVLYSVMVLPGLLVLAGAVLQLKSARLPAVIVWLNVLLVCIIPLRGHMTRYFVPLVPIFGLFLIETVLAIKNWINRITCSSSLKFTGSFVAALLFMLFLAEEALPLARMYTKYHSDVKFGSQSERVDFKLFHYSPAHRALDHGLDWLGNHSSENEIVGTWTPSWVYWRINRQAVIPPLLLDVSEAQRLMQAVPVTYLVIDEAEEFYIRKYAFPVIRNYPDRWNLVYRDPIEPLFIYRIKSREREETQ